MTQSLTSNEEAPFSVARTQRCASRGWSLLAVWLLAPLALVSCKSEPAEQAQAEASASEASPVVGSDPGLDAAPSHREIEFGERVPEVLKVEASELRPGTWRFAVTLSSEYDSPERYADAWRVLDAEGKELGIRVLGHDHAGEQPFTRSGSVKIPAGQEIVFVEGRDQENGWSGQRFVHRLRETETGE